MNISKNFLACGLFILLSPFLLKGMYEASKLPELDVSMQQRTINIHESVIKIIDLGLHRMISSLLWSETLLRSDLVHYKKNDFKSWMFLRLKTITTLDPHFYHAYLNGGIYLSIIKDDDLGAEYIYDRGLSYFPNDFSLNMNASFHYYFELGKLEKSLKSLETIAREKGNKTPRNVLILLAKMKSMNQDEESAFGLIYQLYEMARENTPIRKKYGEILYAIRAQADIRCLNSKTTSNCREIDFYGASYIKDKSNKWISQKAWIPYRAGKASLKK
jgi:hypothetical protein